MTGFIKTNKLLLFLLGICLLGSCQTKQTNVYNIMDFGAKGDGTTDDSPALQAAIDACSEAGGGTVLVPAGHTFLCSPFRLASYVDLHLEPNSCLLANPDESVYTESAFGENRGEGMMWISGKDLKNVSITGTGTIDGNGVSFMGKELEDSYELKPVTDFDPRPHVLTLTNIEKLVIRDITIRNSAYWTVHLIGCRDASIDGISRRRHRRRPLERRAHLELLHRVGRRLHLPEEPPRVRAIRLVRGCGGEQLYDDLALVRH